MKPASAWTLLLVVTSLDFVCCSTDSGPLFLTPIIEQKKYDEARAKSRVDLFAKEANATAHSGFITVNETLGSNMFFLYVQAQQNPSTAPLMLWMQGGPGMSSLFGQFLEFGPLALDADGKLYKRLHTMQSDVSVVYLDVPVGAGYSFTKDTSGYPHNLEGIAAEIAEFLGQFLALFSEYTDRDFYVAGESYGVRYAVAIAYRLLTDQVKRVPLNLQGAAVGDGFMGSFFDVADSSEFLHQVSMLTREGGDEFAKQFSTMRSLLAEDKGPEALQILSQTTFANPTQPTLFQNLTLYNQQASALYSEIPAIMIEFYQYANSTGLREEIHVGLDANFQATNQDLLTSLAFDFLRDITAEVELLLSASKMLVYMGQLDTLFPPTNQRAYLRSLNWSGASEYRSAPRNGWTASSGSDGLSGYIVRARNLAEAVVLGAGHYAALDKSDEVNYLINNFISSSSRFHKPTSTCPLVP